MKMVSSVSRYVLGALFTVMGLNGFLHFLPAAPVPPLAGQFAGALVQSHFLDVVFVIQLVAGLLLLATRYVPLGLFLLAPVIVNIDLFHLLMAPGGLALAIVVSLLWLGAAHGARYAFSPLWQPLERAEERRNVPSGFAPYPTK